MARSFLASTHSLRNENLGQTITPLATGGTISVWIRPNWNSGDLVTHVFFGSGTTAALSDLPSFQKFQDNNIYCGFSSGGDQRIVVSDAGLFASGIWANWVFTWTNNGTGANTLYRNGVVVGSNATMTKTPAAGLTLGNYNSAIAQVACNSAFAFYALWGTPLLRQEVQQLTHMHPLLVRKHDLMQWCDIGMDNTMRSYQRNSLMHGGVTGLTSDPLIVKPKTNKIYRYLDNTVAAAAGGFIPIIGRGPGFALVGPGGLAG